MITFKSFLLEASIRQGLPHITTMDHEQFNNLTKNGKVHIHDVTEKTDGQSFKFGHDQSGFYTQSTGSGDEKMRHPDDYEKRAHRRAEETGKPLDLTASKAFGHIHRILQANQLLQHHLKDQYNKTGQDIAVRGESFYRPWGKPSEHPGEVKFVATSYDPSHMGHTGKIVIHSKLPENQNHDLEYFKHHLSNEHINFDDDKIDHQKGHVDVSDERSKFEGLNHELLSSRTKPSNKEAKMAEQSKFDEIKKSVADKVDSHVKKLNLRPKWGHGSEGAVIHPSRYNQGAPRFKVTSDAFRAYRSSDAAKNFKDKRNDQNK